MLSRQYIQQKAKEISHINQPGRVAQIEEKLYELCARVMMDGGIEGMSSVTVGDHTQVAFQGGPDARYAQPPQHAGVQVPQAPPQAAQVPPGTTAHPGQVHPVQARPSAWEAARVAQAAAAAPPAPTAEDLLAQQQAAAQRAGVAPNVPVEQDPQFGASMGAGQPAGVPVVDTEPEGDAPQNPLVTGGDA